MPMPLVGNRDLTACVGRPQTERLSGTTELRQAVVWEEQAFLYVIDEHRHPDEIRQDCAQPCVPPTHPSMMEDFIERTLRERRTLQGALADMLAKCDRIPSGQERSMLERMIELLREEIALRRDRLHVMN